MARPDGARAFADPNRPVLVALAAPIYADLRLTIEVDPATTIRRAAAVRPRLCSIRAPPFGTRSSASAMPSTTARSTTLPRRPRRGRRARAALRDLDAGVSPWPGRLRCAPSSRSIRPASARCCRPGPAPHLRIRRHPLAAAAHAWTSLRVEPAERHAPGGVATTSCAARPARHGARSVAMADLTPTATRPGTREKLWRLLPEIYRAEDGDRLRRHGPLGELVARIGAAGRPSSGAASIGSGRTSRSRPATTGSSPTSATSWRPTWSPASTPRGRRVDVAKTIYYRRRKGTVGLLEELATDITGWSVRVVELFRRLGRTRHGLDPADRPAGGGRRVRGPAATAQGLVGAAHPHRRRRLRRPAQRARRGPDRTPPSTSTSTPPTSAAAAERPAGTTSPASACSSGGCTALRCHRRRRRCRTPAAPTSTRSTRPGATSRCSRRASRRSAISGSRRNSTRCRDRSRPICSTPPSSELYAPDCSTCAARRRSTAARRDFVPVLGTRGQARPRRRPTAGP